MKTAAPSYDVAVTLTSRTSVQEFAKVFEGLQSLADRNSIALSIRPSRERSSPRLLHLIVNDPARGRRTLVLDVADDPAPPDGDLLSDVDVYFKRSFDPSRTAGLTSELSAKIQPLGLNNPVIRTRTAIRLLAARTRTGRSLAELATDVRQLLALPPPTAFEVTPSTPAEPLILFQTRLWSPAATDPDREAINEERAALIRTLRASFGTRFMGGAFPTDFARARFPDVVSSLPSSMRAYPRLLQGPLIAVYSRGLRNSLAFKMSEYLAASRCIVGHAPRSELPQPLEPGTHFLPFQTPAECVAQCEHLLSRPAEASAMRHANWSYYEAHVETAAHLQNVLRRAFQS